jgi:hypothetical protein
MVCHISYLFIVIRGFYDAQGWRHVFELRRVEKQSLLAFVTGGCEQIMVARNPILICMC